MTLQLAFWLLVSLLSLGSLLKTVVKARSRWLVCMGGITAVMLAALYFHLPRFGGWFGTGQWLIVAGISPRLDLSLKGRVIACAAATLIAALLVVTQFGLIRW